MQTTTHTFLGSLNHQLVARLDIPDDGTVRAWALFAHCFTCSKNLRAVSNINKALTEHGIGVLRFDFTGLGESDGDFADTNFSSNIGDLVEAAEYLAAEFAAPQLLIGHSLGGAAVLQAALKLPSVRAVATIGAPSEPTHVRHMFAGSEEAIAEQGEARVQLAGREFTIRKQFLEDLEIGRMQTCISGLKRALAIFHSPVDNTVGIDNAAQIFQAARHPKSFISLDNADHLLTRNSDSKYVGAVIAHWANRYIDANA